MDEKEECKFKTDDGAEDEKNEGGYEFLKREEPEPKLNFDIEPFKLEGTRKLDSKNEDNIKHKDEIKHKLYIKHNDIMKEKSFFKLKKEGDINGYVSNELLSICKSEKLINDMDYNNLQPKLLENDLEYLDNDFNDVDVQALYLSESRQTKKKERAKPQKNDKKKIFSCSQCSYRSQTRQNFVAHSRVHSATEKHKNKKLQCAHCHYSTHNRSTLTKHLSNHGDYGEESVEAYKCSYCGTRFKYRYSLIRHLSVGHPHHCEKPRPFKCSSCTVTYGTAYELNRHSLTHSRELPYECAHCDYATTRRYILKEHLSRHERTSMKMGSKTLFRKHGSSCKAKNCKDTGFRKEDEQSKPDSRLDLKPFKCAICGFRSSNHSLLKYHIIRQHTREPVFGCSSCDYSTFRQEDLQKHKRSQKHDIFCCEHCDYTCFKYVHIQKHMKTHFKY